MKIKQELFETEGIATKETFGEWFEIIGREHASEFAQALPVAEQWMQQYHDLNNVKKIPAKGSYSRRELLDEVRTLVKKSI